MVKVIFFFFLYCFVVVVCGRLLNDKQHGKRSVRGARELFVCINGYAPHGVELYYYTVVLIIITYNWTVLHNSRRQQAALTAACRCL